jgi:hypothetical protein
MREEVTKVTVIIHIDTKRGNGIIHQRLIQELKSHRGSRNITSCSQNLLYNNANERKYLHLLSPPIILAAEGINAPAATGAFSFAIIYHVSITFLGALMSTLTIDEQVALLMQGTEYGDKELEETMRRELRERLIEAKREGRALRVYCGFDPTTSDPGAWSRCHLCRRRLHIANR